MIFSFLKMGTSQRYTKMKLNLKKKKKSIVPALALKARQQLLFPKYQM